MTKDNSTSIILWRQANETTFGLFVLLPDEDLPDDLPEDESDESIQVGLRQSLQELSDGKGIPLANLWDKIDAE